MQTATDAADLVERYVPLALAVARRMGARLPWLLDDLVSEAGSAAFPTWARRHIRWAVLRRIKIETRKNPTAFRPQLVDVKGRPADLAAFVADEDAPEVGTEIETAELVEHLLGTLPPDRRRHVERHVLDGETCDAIAGEHGTTRGNIGDLIRRDLKKLRKAAGEL